MEYQDLNYKIIKLVIDANHFVADRVSKLKSLGFDCQEIWVKSGGVGTIRRYKGSDGVQISASVGGNNYARKAYVAFPQ